MQDMKGSTGTQGQQEEQTMHVVYCVIDDGVCGACGVVHCVGGDESVG
jgi:hypothetical protein